MFEYTDLSVSDDHERNSVYYINGLYIGLLIPDQVTTVLVEVFEVYFGPPFVKRLRTEFTFTVLKSYCIRVYYYV